MSCNFSRLAVDGDKVILYYSQQNSKVYQEKSVQGISLNEEV